MLPEQLNTSFKTAQKIELKWPLKRGGISSGCLASGWSFTRSLGVHLKEIIKGKGFREKCLKRKVVFLQCGFSFGKFSIMGSALFLSITSQHLNVQVADLTARVQGYEEGSVDKHSVTRLEGKLRDYESRLELEQSQRQRFEVSTTTLGKGVAWMFLLLFLLNTLHSIFSFFFSFY